MSDSTSVEVAMNIDSEEESGDDTSASSRSSTLDLIDGHISPVICKDGIVNNLEELLNHIASGWKYHVSNTDGVKQAWSKFDNVTNKICSFMAGKQAVMAQITSTQNLRWIFEKKHFCLYSFVRWQDSQLNFMFWNRIHH